MKLGAAWNNDGKVTIVLDYKALEAIVQHFGRGAGDIRCVVYENKFKNGEKSPDYVLLPKGFKLKRDPAGTVFVTTKKGGEDEVPF